VRIVFDTNVIIAGLVAEGLCREIVEIHLVEHKAVLARPLWDELVEKLRVKFGLDTGQLPLLRLYRRHADWAEVKPLAAPVCRDPDDDWVLATAIAGQAELIVTGDEDLLVLEAYQGIPILSPRQFVERIHRGGTRV
jgi:putative PIN family toxin of toxin-antitoxin system